MLEIGFEIAVGVAPVPQLTIFPPSIIFDVAVVPVVPVLVERVLVQAMPKPRRLLESQQLAFGKLVSIFVAGKLCGSGDVPLATANLKSHVPLRYTMLLGIRDSDRKIALKKHKSTSEVFTFAFIECHVSESNYAILAN